MRRGLLVFVSGDSFLAYFDITDAGRAELPQAQATLGGKDTNR